ncbi:MAG: hypothetical protein SW127_23275 [Actinomycetota bacterium]|nr:hypothetical protein [Actinomycetota bacterium]
MNDNQRAEPSIDYYPVIFLPEPTLSASRARLLDAENVAKFKKSMAGAAAVGLALSYATDAMKKAGPGPGWNLPR